MKALLTPLLMAALAVQAAGTLGGAFFCRMLGERLPECCCPAEEAGRAEPLLASAACCDALAAAASAAGDEAQPSELGKLPPRSAPALDVALPGPALAAFFVEADVLAWPRASGPPGHPPVFLSLKQLLL
jgi:hypothetical protein